jgi:SanA protein
LITAASSYQNAPVAQRRSPNPKPRRWLARAGKWSLALAGCAAGGLVACDWWVGTSTEAWVHDQLAELKPAPVALLLGTSPRNAGQPNPFYRARIKAAQELYAAGKVAGILVSGDNRRADYNEPVMMRADLVRAGVPAKVITMDFAGFRTLDSVVRAKAVFQQSRVIVVSQRFHAQRALFLAQHVGLDAEAYAAEEPPLKWWIRVRAREVFARALACMDVWILNRQPHFLGPVEPVKLQQR